MSPISCLGSKFIRGGEIGHYESQLSLDQTARIPRRCRGALPADCRGYLEID